MIIRTGKSAAVLVIGAGVAGIQASLDLAAMGFPVVLVERSPFIGGTMSRLERVFPVRECAQCILAPKMAEVRRHKGIRLLTMSRLESLSGRAGDFTATVVREPRYIDVDLCDGCGLCVQNCPVKAEPARDARRAVYAPPPRSVPGAYLVDRRRCLHLGTRGWGERELCGICAKVCPAGAVDFDRKEEVLTFGVGAVILATGITPFDPGVLPQYGYGRLPGVLTSMEFEQMTGEAADRGEPCLSRPGDLRTVRRIAWLQCIGSRNLKIGNGYCSSICCMNTAKEATLVRERWPQTDCAVFYTDFRVWGPDQPRSFATAVGVGVRYERCRVGEVRSRGDGLDLRYVRRDGRVVEEGFDLVVLAVGLAPSRDTMQLAGKLGLGLNRWGFCQSPDADTGGRPGVYLAGACRAPQDITASVIDGSAAASRAAAGLARRRPHPPLAGTPAGRPAVSTRGDGRDRAPAAGAAVGVFVCHCGTNIAGAVAVAALGRLSAGLPDVVCVRDCRYACAEEGQTMIRESVREHGLNRVVVAACSPHLHERLFAANLEAAGLNASLLEMANIREQCSWVHRGPEATAKAGALVRRAVAGARLHTPLPAVTVKVQPAALVVGGGAAGLAAALDLAGHGIAVHLVEKSGRLGGLALASGTLPGDGDWREYVAGLAGAAGSHPLITVYRSSGLRSVAGRTGDFTAVVETAGGRTEDVRFGAAVIAAGGREGAPREYLLGVSPRVLTVTELGRALAEDGLPGAGSCVFILCAGSRTEDIPYCSMVCCSQALDAAFALMARRPGVRVTVLYRDMRTSSFREEKYRAARAAGMVFIQYTALEGPLVEESGGRLCVGVREPILDVRLRLDADLVVLAPPVLPPADADGLARLFRVPLNQDGFFQEVHGKLVPVDLPVDGVYAAGLATGPKFTGESIAQGRAAAARAMKILARGTWVTAHATARVEDGLCAGCRVCALVCPYGAVRLDGARGVAVVEEFLCKGCGLCAAACPAGACTVANAGREQVLAEIAALCG